MNRSQMILLLTEEIMDGKSSDDMISQGFDKLSTVAPLVHKMFSVLGKVDDSRAQFDKRITAAMAVSVLFSGRSQRFRGLSKLFGVAFLLLGVHRGIMAMLNKTRVCCSVYTASAILDETDVTIIGR